ncbi:MAG: SufE family protein [Fuerstiella sp.]|nr:SufE family protein [Fuerstiella sp.]
MSIDELLEEFEELLDWEEQCDFLIDLGFELPEFSVVLKTEENIVQGCQSLVWLVAEPEVSDGVIVVRIRADSDSMIVKGLISVLLAAYSGKTPQQILDVDIEALFERMGLNQHLSSTRRNGLHGMVRRIRSIAASNCA